MADDEPLAAAGGIDPAKRQGFPLRLPPELLAELRRWAAHDLRSLNAQIEYLLRDAVKRRGRIVDGPEGKSAQPRKS